MIVPYATLPAKENISKTVVQVKWIKNLHVLIYTTAVHFILQVSHFTYNISKKYQYKFC